MGGIRFLKKIETAEERGLTGTRGTDDHKNLAFVEGEINAAKNLIPAEALMDVFHLKYSFRHGIKPPS